MTEPRSMTRRYILALSLVAALTVAGQVVVQWSLATLEEDTTIVNQCGRQRMLSQRIPRLTLSLMAEASSGGPRSNTRRELQEQLTLWQSNHSGLAGGRSSAELTEGNLRSVEPLFAALDPSISHVARLVEQALAREAAGSVPLLSAAESRTLVEQSDAFLEGMDAIVAQLAADSRQRVSRLQWIERGLLLATMLVLVCEGCLIFSPAVASLAGAFARLQALTQELARAKDAAEAASRAKTEFLARVSHELRTPLHAALGMLRLVRRERLPRAERQRIEAVIRAARTLQRLVDDLLDVAGAEAGNPLLIVPTAIDVRRVIAESIAWLKPLARRKDLTLSSNVQLGAEARYWLDGQRLHQMVTNLLQNAIRYTDSGSVACSCHLEAEAGAERLVIRVTDTGCGIALEDQQRIFDSFVRLGPPNGSVAGSAARPAAGSAVGGARLGLGLAITASLARAMGGSLALTSTPGHGSTFTLTLKALRVEPSSSVGEGSQTKSRLNRARSRTKPRRAVLAPDAPGAPDAAARAEVLVVDDHRVNRIVLKAYLRRLGWTAVAARDLPRAWELFQQHRPEWILLDAHLPDEDPLALVRRVRRAAADSGAQVGIAIVTADVHFSAEPFPADAQVDAVLTKPLAIEDLQVLLSGQIAEQGLPAEGSVDEAALAAALERLAQFSLQCASLRETHTTAAAGGSRDDGFGGLRSQLRKLLEDQLPVELERLRSALSRGDLQQAALIAHRVRGAAGNAGWDELATACAQLEEIAESGQRPMIARVPPSLTDSSSSTPKG
jgi:signal transduction histidine kinase/HPt (histidine-containing phosphotransfer) domain-containing protein/DNA-binding NarL/FixJ family response regulator